MAWLHKGSAGDASQFGGIIKHAVVDNGNIITTAGVSAGIDGALYLVSRLNGMEAALQTARYMEYDKWDPKAGRADVKTEIKQ